MGTRQTAAEKLGARLKTERNERGWSLAHLAQKLTDEGLTSVYATTVAKIESGARAVRVDELTAFADAFEMSLDALTDHHPRRGDLAYLRRSLGNTITNMERLIWEMNDVLGRTIDRVRDADDGTAKALTGQASALHQSLSAAVLVARQIIKEEL
jgi:transcriptional regulator with XRE-family HTH domain